MSLRVVIATRILPVALGFHAVLREAGHEPIGLVTIRDTENRYGSEFTLDALLRGLPPELEVIVPARRSSMAPLLAALRPDLVVCMGFPWKIPVDALDVPSLGWLNGHPSLLPRHRGPIPVAWAIRNGDEDFGITYHRMDAELDTGPVFAQRRLPIGEYVEPDVFFGRTGPAVMEVFREAIDALARGEAGTVQDGGEYETFFTDDDAWIDPGSAAAEAHRLVWAWRFALPRGELRGALVDLDGETVRVLASSLAEVEGARRLDCADGPLWLVETEPAQAGAAAGAESAAPS